MRALDFSESCLPQARKNTPLIGATSRRDRLRKVDGRTRIGRRLRQIERDLSAHVGGQPSATQKILIDRLAADIVRRELYEAEIASGADLSAHDGRVLHALQNSIRLGLRELGLRPAAPKPPSLAEYLAAKTAAEAIS
jgi:hypothetical protein